MMSRRLWSVVGTILLFLTGGTVAFAQGPGAKLDKEVERALGKGGLAVLPDMTIAGCSLATKEFTFTSVTKLFQELDKVRSTLTQTYQGTVSGVTIVLGSKGCDACIPNFAMPSSGGSGGAALATVADDQRVLAIAGNGGLGGFGQIDKVAPNIVVPTTYSGADGGAGGAADVTCGRRSRVFAFGGDGGSGGNGGALAGRRGNIFKPPPPQIIGNNGSGGKGGKAKATFDDCNDINSQGGDGGAGGSLIFGVPPAPGSPGAGGDAEASSPTPPNVGTVQGGKGAGIAANGAPIKTGAGAAPLAVGVPTRKLP